MYLVLQAVKYDEGTTTPWWHFQVTVEESQRLQSRVSKLRPTDQMQPIACFCK